MSVLKNSDAPTSLRCSAAEALGQLDYSKGSVDALPLVKAISQFTLENVQETVQWFQDEVARLPDDPTASGRRFESLEGSTAQQEADPLVVRTRRQMGYVLWCSSRGLAGILRGTSDATQKQAITAIGKQMQTVLKALNDGGETVTPRELLNKIGPPAVRLEQMVKSL